MAFLTDDDYKDQIQDAQLAALTVGDTFARERMEGKVQEEISLALRVRYDVPSIFSKEGAGRNQWLVAAMVDMVIYHLHKRINPGQVPELRLTAYTNAKEDLDKIARGEFLPDLPLVGDADGDGTDDKNVVQSGGRPPRNPYY